MINLAIAKINDLAEMVNLVDRDNFAFIGLTMDQLILLREVIASLRQMIFSKRRFWDTTFINNGLEPFIFRLEPFIFRVKAPVWVIPEDVVPEESVNRREHYVTLKKLPADEYLLPVESISITLKVLEDGMLAPSNVEIIGSEMFLYGYFDPEYVFFADTVNIYDDIYYAILNKSTVKEGAKENVS